MQQTDTKRMHEKACLGGIGDQLRIVQATELLTYIQVVHIQTRICSKK